MTRYEHADDSTVPPQLRDALSAVATPERPALAAITSRGRAHQRRRLARYAGLGVAGVAASTALALNLAGVITTTSAGSTGTIRTAAFTFTSNADDTDTVVIVPSLMRDPAALRHVLEAHDIPALVQTGATCVQASAEPDQDRSRIVSTKYLGGSPQRWEMLIHPAAIPSGIKLFIGYYDIPQPAGAAEGMIFELIYASSDTCSYLPASPAAP
jgi:hypothetical protein